MSKIGCITLVVRDYDEAIKFYTDALGFTLVEDTPQGNGERWVQVAPPGSSETCLLLAQAVNSEQEKAIGNQAGGRVFLIYHSDNFERDYQRMQTFGVKFEEEPRHEPYGTVAVFQDLCGNRWDLLETKTA